MESEEEEESRPKPTPKLELLSEHVPSRPRMSHAQTEQNSYSIFPDRFGVRYDEEEEDGGRSEPGFIRRSVLWSAPWTMEEEQHGFHELDGCAWNGVRPG